MNQINQDVIKARQIVEGYKKYNKETVEVLSRYDPIRKCRYFEKVKTDPNANKFVKEFVKSGRKEKVIQIKKPAKLKPNKEKVVKVKPIKIPKEKPKKLPSKPILKEKKEILKPSKAEDFIQNTLISNIYNLHLQGKSNEEISKIVGENRRIVATNIYNRKIQLGIYIPAENTREKIIDLQNKGLTASEIAKQLNIANHTVSFHVKKWNESKSEKEIQEENDEILYWVAKKAKENNVDYCYSLWIGKANLKMKHNLTSLEISRRCHNLINEGKLIEIPERRSPKYGRMYKIKKP